MEAAKSDSITLKLVIDTKANKVLFAEASKDFVDFLFFLLTLPIGTAIKILSNDSLVGSIQNLYNSFEGLDHAYLQPKIVKDGLLFHVTSTSTTKASLLLGTSHVTPSYVIYKNYSCDKGCKNDEAVDKGVVKCSKCGVIMTTETYYLRDTSNYVEHIIGDGPDGYIDGLVSYMIYDDLSVRLMSIVSSISLMNEVIAGSHLNVLQEKEVKVGKKEALELLKFSLQSKRVLTDVFLNREKKKNTDSDFQVKFDEEKNNVELEFQEKLDRYMKEMKQ